MLCTHAPQAPDSVQLITLEGKKHSTLVSVEVNTGKVNPTVVALNDNTDTMLVACYYGQIRVFKIRHECKICNILVEASGLLCHGNVSVKE